MFIPTPGQPLQLDDAPTVRPLSILSRVGWLALTLLFVSMLIAVVFAVAPDIRDLICTYANCNNYPRP